VIVAVTGSPEGLSIEEASRLIEVLDRVILAQSIEELAQALLPGLARLFKGAATFLYVAEPRLCAPFFDHFGLSAAAVPKVQAWCAGQFQQVAGENAGSTLHVPSLASTLMVYPLQHQGRPIGLLGLLVAETEKARGGLPRQSLLPLLSHAISGLMDRWELAKQTKFLNTYLTVSSMIAQCLDLPELLEAVLTSVMETVAAEEASILLLDEDGQNFEFHSLGGPSKETLQTATFAADQGIAGAVLKNQKSEVINDVRQDSRFYGRIDADSGVVTRNMMAIPLTAGEEKIGVMEVLNKSGGEPFTDDERLLLESVAEEIAFAIRNAKIFEYVVNSYCKQRQGATSCKGCKRPLKSWTPCAKYLEKSL
jgi:hypothetical protein